MGLSGRTVEGTNRTIREDPAFQRQLFALFQHRQAQLSSLDEKYWMIIGQGSIGAKAGRLKRDTWAALQAGFTMMPRIVLAMGFFDEFKKRNGVYDTASSGLSRTEIQNRIRAGEFNETEIQQLKGIIDYFYAQFEGVPLAVRSSAYGDAEGTGIYFSGFSPNTADKEKTLEKFIGNIKTVLISEFSEVAIVFRKKLGLSDGMAVMIEPVFGQEVGKRYESILYGPLYGGIAYSSRSGLKGYAFLCEGLPTAATKGTGIQVWADSLDSPERIEQNELLGQDSTRSLDGVALPSRMPFMLYDCAEYVNASDGTLFEGYSPSLQNPIRQKNLSWLFSRLKKLEELLYKSQYIEWAVRMRDDQIEVALIQIADAKPMDFDPFVAFPETDKTILTSPYVITSGKFRTNTIIFLDSFSELSCMKELNEQYRDYILLINGHLVPTYGQLGLSYSEISNTRLIAELLIERLTGNDVAHNGPPEGHFKGLLEKTGIIFIVIPEHFDPYKKLKEFDITPQGSKGPRIYRVSVEVIASEIRQKALVNLLE